MRIITIKNIEKQNFSPNELWKNTNNDIFIDKLKDNNDTKLNDKDSKEDKIAKVAYQNKKDLERFKSQVKEQDLKVGDYVRISLKAFNTDVRKLYKSSVIEQKKINIFYTTRIYRIKSIFRKGTSTTRPQYVLETLDGKAFKPYKVKDDKRKRGKRDENVGASSKKVFFGSELMKISKTTQNPKEYENDEFANKLNLINVSKSKPQTTKDKSKET